MSEFEEFVAEADITALAVAVGVMKDVPVELPSAEAWAQPIPGHVPYDDHRVTRARRAAKPYEDAHRAERDERIGHAGGSNIDPRTNPKEYAAWLVGQMIAHARRRRNAA